MNTRTFAAYAFAIVFAVLGAGTLYFHHSVVSIETHAANAMLIVASVLYLFGTPKSKESIFNPEAIATTINAARVLYFLLTAFLVAVIWLLWLSFVPLGLITWFSWPVIALAGLLALYEFIKIFTVGR